MWNFDYTCTTCRNTYITEPSFCTCYGIALNIHQIIISTRVCVHLYINVLFAPVQRSASKLNTKVLTDMLDKVTKERDQLKKQVKKMRKASTYDVLISPDPPPEEDSTLLEITFAHQQAEEADKRAAEAERRARDAEKEAKVADLKHREAEIHVATLEKELDGRLIEVQVSSMYKRLLNFP